MRAPLAIAILASATVASAGETSQSARRRVLDEQRSLTAAEIERYAAPYLPAIKACYVEHGRVRGATGELSLHLIVHRDGEVFELTVDAPGVTGKRLRELERCIQRQVTTWHFPVRRDGTTAVLPYYFLRLALPGAGPQPSCWNPRGCPERR